MRYIANGTGRIHWHSAHMGFQAVDAAEAAGDPNRPAAIGAHRQWAHAGGHGHPRTAAAAARQKAFSRGLSCSTRAIIAFTTSTGDTCFVRMAAARSVAGI